MSRVIGADSPEVADAMRALYSRYVDAELDSTDLLTAELVKTTENAYRDVNIAFANQVALICQEVGGDVWKVRELVNKSPGRNMLLPGAGVGGHCIPKDPWLLASALPEGSRAPLIETAREINASMPSVVARLTVELLQRGGVEARGAVVAVLGYAYLEDSDDTRDSPSEHLLPELSRLGIKTRVHDPFVDGMGGDVYEVIAGADCAILMVRHSEYHQLDLGRAASAMARPLLVDARHAFSVEDLQRAGFRFTLLGSSKRAGTEPYAVGTQD